MPALTQQLENLALSHGHHGAMRDRDGLSSPTTNQRFGTV